MVAWLFVACVSFAEPTLSATQGVPVATPTGVDALGLPLGHQLERSAMGAASLLLSSPTKLDECHCPTVMTYTVHYRQR
jgi:hypothetical protein